jgi:hypothetical protein
MPRTDARALKAFWKEIDEDFGTRSWCNTENDELSEEDFAIKMAIQAKVHAFIENKVASNIAKFEAKKAKAVAEAEAKAEAKKARAEAREARAEAKKAYASASASIPVGTDISDIADAKAIQAYWKEIQEEVLVLKGKEEVSEEHYDMLIAKSQALLVHFQTKIEAKKASASVPVGTDISDSETP